MSPPTPNHFRYGRLSAILVLLVSGCSDRSAATPPIEPNAGETKAAPTRQQTPVTTKLRFDEVTLRTGIEFVPANGQERGYLSIIESVGTGVALADFDGDGRLDLFACGGGTYDERGRPIGRAAALFRNGAGFRFREITESAGIPKIPFYSHAAVAGDYDNDGFPDLLITGLGGLMLLHNCGDGTFREVTPQSRLKSDQWNTSAGWGDFNGDGHLDLFVVRYVNWTSTREPRCPKFGDRDVCPPERFQGVTDLLYFSNGDGTFRDVSRQAGIVPGGNGLGVVLGDVDRDGHLDAYVANDASPNVLYLNDGTGKLREAGVASGVAFGGKNNPDGSMGVDLGDFNNDGRPDLWVTNFEGQLFGLYRNMGSARFEYVSPQSGMSRFGQKYVGFGTVLFDADLDGDEDIIATNGHVRRRPHSGLVRQLPLLLENRGREGFVNVAAAAGPYLQNLHMGRGLAVGDLDGDGDLDVVISHLNEPISVLSNVTVEAGNWLRVRLVGTRSSRDAIGATITIRIGENRQMRQVKGGGSYLSTSSLAATFGIGPHHRIDELRVDWPSGGTTINRHVSAGSDLTLFEPR